MICYQLIILKAEQVLNMIKFQLNRPQLNQSINHNHDAPPRNTLYLSGLINTVQVAEQMTLNHCPTSPYLPPYSQQSFHPQPPQNLITFGRESRNRIQILSDVSTKNIKHHNQKIKFHHQTQTRGKDMSVFFPKNNYDKVRNPGNAKIIFNYSSPVSNKQMPIYDGRSHCCKISQDTLQGKYSCRTQNEIGVSQGCSEFMKDSPVTHRSGSIFSSSGNIPTPQIPSMLNLSQEMEDLFKDDNNEEKQTEQASSAVKQLEQLFKQ